MSEARKDKIVYEEVYQNGFVAMLYNAAHSLLIVKWKRQIDLEERKEGFLWGLDFSIKYNVKIWLIDDEEIFVITQQEQKWVENDWTEMVAKSGIRKIAVYHPDHYNSLMAFTDFTQRAQKNYQHHGATRHEVFTDMPTALKWLLTEQN
ncbi:hypothetical protein [Pontibacter anaerobius]|uniref:STAS/SEC14 domain-containing protein n=1 Tax=Pontibacter anaerobius TaxID=2993940 RepID=A0ABT3RJD8_9BACT|nr:hypothetical protein [Pontibacter anaerobius]MCX2741732.1 hypothetical protein [Pontibacter anaerobius]